METINIRFATPTDARELAQLRFALRSTGEGNVESKTAFIERCRTWMTNALGQSNWRCWVIEHSGALAGALWLQLIEKVPNPTSEPETYAYITNFYVVDALRGKGLGSRMLDEALKWCREQDVHMVILWPSDKSRPLYERYGFKIRDDILGLLIEDRD